MSLTISTTHLHREIAAEISSTSRYCDRILQWVPGESDTGELLDLIDCPQKQAIRDPSDFPDLSDEREKCSLVLFNSTFNFEFDVQKLLTELKTRLSRTSRVVAVCYNPYLRWLYRLASFLGIRTDVPTTFVTRAAMQNLAKISGYEIVRERPAGYLPFRLFGLGTLVSAIVAIVPLIRSLGLVSVVLLRPVIATSATPSLSVIIPARNEEGNIEAALERLPDFGGAETEVVFVEGHSQDGTWEEIQRVVAKYSSRVKCVAYQQTGIGKADAVRLGFERASGDLLMILDADLTMPPEMLSRYYDAYCRGDGDFVNGSRLVYPMEGAAMRFLNHVGNVFFAKALSWIVGVSLSDVLCGTKVVSRYDYQRFRRWRTDFGDFDPFGDFELIFPAAVLGLGIVEIPVRYRDRTYGSTQIQRFRHGWNLLRMTGIGFWRIKLGRGA